jgi:hypothetical protein
MEQVKTPLEHVIRIDSEEFKVSVLGTKAGDGSVSLDGGDLLRAQREVGLELILRYKDARTLKPAYFNFLVSISGLRGKELAEYLQVEPSNISQWRREKGISAVAWQAFRMLFFDLFKNGKVTNEILLSNRAKPEVA